MLRMRRLSLYILQNYIVIRLTKIKILIIINIYWQKYYNFQFCVHYQIFQGIESIIINNENPIDFKVSLFILSLFFIFILLN